MAKTVDVFGFDELKKAFERCEKRYPDYADALLMAQGQAVNKRTKALTPVRTKKLRNSWRLKKVKLYKGGKVRVVRIQSAAASVLFLTIMNSYIMSKRRRFKNKQRIAVHSFKLCNKLRIAVNLAEMLYPLRITTIYLYHFVM